MKIAVPTKNEMVDSHFGHCEYYTIFTIDNETKAFFLKNHFLLQKVVDVNQILLQFFMKWELR